MDRRPTRIEKVCGLVGIVLALLVWVALAAGAVFLAVRVVRAAWGA